MNTAWIQCPITCAEGFTKTGGLRIGWSKIRVVPLAKRRLQCYRCLAVGHTRVNCRSAIDRSNIYFNCGKEGHKAGGCRTSPHCPVCAGRNMPAGHRAGGDGCAPYNSPMKAVIDETMIYNANKNGARENDSTSKFWRIFLWWRIG